MRRPTVQQVQQKKARFLEVYAREGNLSETGRQTGISRNDHYDWLRDDPEYRVAFDEAETKAIDAMETEARRRAILGTDEPVFHRGEVVGAIRRYSDTLLIFLMKGARPERYRERVDVTLNVRETAGRIAEELGMPVEEVIAEAERIVAGR